VNYSIRLAEDAKAAMKQIAARTQLDPSGVFSFSLNLMQWVVKQHDENRVVASLDKAGLKYRELDLATLFASAKAKEPAA